MFKQTRRTRTLTPRRLAALAGLAVCAVAVTSDAAFGQARDPFSNRPRTSASASKPVQGEVTVSEHLTVDLHVQDEDLGNVLQMLSIQSQRNIVMSSAVSATVNANLYDVTFYEALEAILHVNGYGFIERGNFIFVYTLEEITRIEQAARKPISRVVMLNYLNANDAAEFVTPLLSEIGQIRTNGDPGSFTLPDRSPIGDESYALSAMLVVFDYPEHVDEIEALVQQLDTRPAQVLVEATILQTSLSEDNAFGIDFSIIGSVNFTDFINTGGPLSAARALQQGGTGSSGEGFSPPDNRGTGIGSTAGNTGGPATFRVGVVRDDFSVFLRMLDEVTDFTVLSNPKILALNRQPARVLVGTKVGFLNTTSTETSTTQSVEFLDTGTQLQFRPFISKDGFIRMELNPSVSEAEVGSQTDVTGAIVSIPNEITSELTTNVLVRDGMTIVLGGLFKETTTLSRRQVPVLGDIPVIGAAFRGHEDSTDRSEIIFLITPTIVNDNVLLEEGNRAKGHVERVRAGTRQGLLPWSRDRITAGLNIEAERLAAAGQEGKAIWKLRRSLELNPNQPDALRLREQLFNEYATWPSRSVLDMIMTEEYEQRINQLPELKTRPQYKADPFARRGFSQPGDWDAPVAETRPEPRTPAGKERKEPPTEVASEFPEISLGPLFHFGFEFEDPFAHLPADPKGTGQVKDAPKQPAAPSRAQRPAVEEFVLKPTPAEPRQADRAKPLGPDDPDADMWRLLDEIAEAWEQDDDDVDPFELGFDFDPARQEIQFELVTPMSFDGTLEGVNFTSVWTTLRGLIDGGEGGSSAITGVNPDKD